MKSLLVRVGVLGTLFLLGWIAIAQAQRGSGQLVEERQTDSSPGADFATPTPPSENPLRAPFTPPAAPASPEASDSSGASVASDIPDAEQALGPPTADPFGLQNRQPQSSARNEYHETGPALAPVSTVRPVDDRYAAAPAGSELPNNRNEARDDGRYAAPAYSPAPNSYGSSTGGEPAPFRADPYAVPANPPPLGAVSRDSIGVTPQRGFADQPATGNVGTGQPGDSRLEGVQSPQLTIQKTAPQEVQVGQPATFRVVVRNVGQTPACNVEIRDQTPRGARLMNTRPQAANGSHGELLWSLGTIRPGEEAVVEMDVIPTDEGEIGSVATVHFTADATARSLVTRPQLFVETAIPSKVLIGDQVTLSIIVSNTGTGVASGVVIDERIPTGLHHQTGSELEYVVGDLKPGESRKLELPLVADQPGLVVNMLTARGDGNLRVEDRREVEVIAPQLEVSLDGPKRRYLERPATYQLSVANPGTAPAEGIELSAALPVGLRFISANNAGYYEEATRTVYWRLEKLPAKEVGSVQLVTEPVKAGQHAIRLRGTAEKGLVVEREQPVMIEGMAAILYQVKDLRDPIGPGGETTYEIRVENQGSKAAANIQLAVLLPPEMQPIAAEGPTRYAIDGNRVFFDGLAQLTPKAETVYRVKVRAMRPGDLRVRFQLKTDDMQSPVTKEESTRVYADQ